METAAHPTPVKTHLTLARTTDNSEVIPNIRKTPAEKIPHTATHIPSMKPKTRVLIRGVSLAEVAVLPAWWTTCSSFGLISGMDEAIRIITRTIKYEITSGTATAVTVLSGDWAGTINRKRPMATTLSGTAARSKRPPRSISIRAELIIAFFKYCSFN